jgi:hypothetical protein
MKKYLLLWVLFFSTTAFASTPVERLLLINDFEGWLNGEKTFFNWIEFRQKKVLAFSDIKQPAHIYIDFRDNPIAAEDKYKESFQSFYGQVSGIEKNIYGEPLLVFDVAYVNKIYASGLTKREVVKLKIPNMVNLLCIGFEVNPFGDIGANCSMFKSAQRMIAVNSIQSLDREGKLNVILSSLKKNAEYSLAMSNLNRGLDPSFNQECTTIDSTNYSSCLALMDDALRAVNNKKAP